jgi:hypothetical protein
MIERMGRQEFLVELGGIWEPGDHLSALGPTGRGKSTLLGQLIPHAVKFDTAVILSPKGRDKAYGHLGHPTRDWPPKVPWDEKIRMLLGAPERHSEAKPKVWRVEVPIKRAEDIVNLRAAYTRVLNQVFTRRENERKSLMIVVDDSRYVCDPRGMQLGPHVVHGLIIGRSKKISMVNNFQRPGLGVPREGLDQVTHALISKNRDRDTAKRLTEISGAIDPKELEAAITSLDYYEVIWVNGRADEWRIIASK